MVEIYGVGLEVWLGVVVAGSALLIYLLKWYQKANADGSIGLDDVIGGLEGGEDLVDDLVDKSEELAEELKKAEAEKKAAEEEAAKLEAEKKAKADSAAAALENTTA